MRILGCAYEADLDEWVYICSCHCNFCDTNVEQLKFPLLTRPALKATSTTHAADTTKGQSGVFLLVEVGGVDDIAAEWCTYEVSVATFAT